MFLFLFFNWIWFVVVQCYKIKTTMYLYDDQKNSYNDIGMSNTKVLATLDNLEFCFLFVNGWSLLSYSSLIFNVKRDTWGVCAFCLKKYKKKRIIPEATGEEIMHHALLNFKEWRLIEMHKKLVFYWLNRIKAAVHSQRIIIELVLHCNSFTKSLYQIHLSRLDLLIWL